MRSRKNNHTAKGYRYRGSNKGLAAILFLIFFLGLSSIIYTDSYEKTLEEQRKLSYGAWHFAVFETDVTTYQSLASHAMVESAGQMEIGGLATDEDGRILGSVGYCDDALMDIGNMELLDGRLPRSSNEIAVEASCLNLMGISYELGQQIPIVISSEGNDGEIVEKEYKFTLCGIVKNYSSYWKSNSYWLVSFFISPELFHELPQSELYVFAQLKPTYAGNVDSLTVLCVNSGAFVKNGFTYLQYSDEDTPATNSVILQTAIILAGCIAIIILMNNDLNQRRNSFITMRILGATKPQIIQIFFQKKVLVILLFSAAGIACGLFLPYLVVLLLNTVLTQPVYFQIIIGHFLQAVILFFAGLVFSLIFSLIRLFQIPLRGKPAQQVSVQTLPKRKKKLRANNTLSLLDSAGYSKKLLSIALTFIASAFVFISAYQAWGNYTTYAEFSRNYPEDYSFGMISSYYAPQTMSEESLNKIKNAYGVKDVQAFSVSEYYALSFSSAFDEQYADVVHEHLAGIVNHLPEEQVCGALVGISDNLYPFYAREADSELLCEGGLAENEVILYLPDFYLLENGDLDQVDLSVGLQKTSLLSENTISVGDTVNIDIGGEGKPLTIAGIIRSFEESTPFSINPARPYSLICSENTYRQLLGHCECAYALVYGDPTMVQYQTDVELSKIQTGLYFLNNRIERSQQAQQLALQVVLALIISVSGFLVTTLIRFGIYAAYEKQEIERYRMLYQLGMPKHTILLGLGRSALYNSLIGGALAIVVLLCYRYMQERATILSFDGYVKPSSLQFFADACQRCICYTDWLFVFVMVIVVTVLNVLLLFLHSYRYIYYNAVF